MKKHILDKQRRAQQTQQENQLREISDMTSQLPNPPQLTSYIGELQKMTEKFQLPMVMTSQKQQSIMTSQQRSMTSQQSSITSQQISMTSQQSNNDDARPDSMQLKQQDGNFLERNEN